MGHNFSKQNFPTWMPRPLMRAKNRESLAVWLSGCLAPTKKTKNRGVPDSDTRPRTGPLVFFFSSHELATRTMHHAARMCPRAASRSRPLPLLDIGVSHHSVISRAEHASICVDFTSKRLWQQRWRGWGTMRAFQPYDPAIPRLLRGKGPNLKGSSIEGWIGRTKPCEASFGNPWWALAATGARARDVVRKLAPCLGKR